MGQTLLYGRLGCAWLYGGPKSVCAGVGCGLGWLLAHVSVAQRRGSFSYVACGAVQELSFYLYLFTWYRSLRHWGPACSQCQGRHMAKDYSKQISLGSTQIITQRCVRLCVCVCIGTRPRCTLCVVSCFCPVSFSSSATHCSSCPQNWRSHLAQLCSSGTNSCVPAGAVVSK